MSAPRHSSGFTLIEVLVVVVVMLAVVSLLVELFTSADEMSARGTGRAVSDNQARVALQLLSADLREALADPVLGGLHVSKTALTNDTYGVEASELYAVTLNADAGTGRAARVVGYEVRPSPNRTNLYDLVRRVAAIPVAATGSVASVYDGGVDLRDALAGSSDATVAHGVALFRVGACDSNGVMWTEIDAAGTDGWPRYVDVYLELLDERDATKVADLLAHGVAGSVWQTRMDEWVRRYATRIHFDNRHGYKDR